MKLKPPHLALLAAIPWLAAQHAGAAGRYDVVNLSLPGLTGGTAFTQVTAINDQGQVTGYASGTYNGVANSYSFLYANGGYTVLNLGSSGASRVFDINNAGQIVGSIATSTTLTGFVYNNGTTTALVSGSTGSGNLGAYAINERGEIAGNNGSAAFIQTVGGMVVIPGTTAAYAPAGINQAGQVVGTLASTGGGFVYANGVLNAVPTATLYAINNSGTSVGSTNSPTLPQALTYSNGVVTSLALGQIKSAAKAINDAGQIVGYSYNTTNTASHANLWAGGVSYDLSVFAPAGSTWTDAVGINATGQIIGTSVVAGKTQSFLLTLQPDWQGGNGNWDDTSHWSFGGLVTGFTLSSAHDVAITPSSASATVMGAANASVKSLTVGADASNVATFNLNGGYTQTSAGTTLKAGGQLVGSGTLGGNLTLNSGGRLQVDAGQTLQHTGGSFTNAGSVDVTGTALNIAGLRSFGAASSSGSINALNARVEFNGGLVNSGQLNLQNSMLRVAQGMSNGGQLNMTGGVNSVSGNVTVTSGGKVIVSGNSLATFYDTVDVKAGAELRVSPGSTATFFGQVLQRTGSSFSGGGTSYYEGGLSIGGSPGLGSNGGSVQLGTGNVYLQEIGGTTGCTASCESNDALRNSSYDRYVVGGNLTFGGTLKLVSWNGYVGKVGDSYDIFDWGSSSAQFASIDASGFVVDAGAGLDYSQLYTLGVVSVVSLSPVPEAAGSALWLAGLGLLGGLWRLRRGRRAGLEGRKFF